MAASTKKDHRYADAFRWHRPGQDYLSLCGVRRSRQGAREEEVHTATVADVHRQHADFADRVGGLFRSALPRTGITEARPRRATDSCSVCEAFREVEQKRLRGCGGDCRTVERKNVRFVPIKTDDQLDLQAIHRVRDRLISRRTAVINQLRAFLLERGLVFAQTPAKLKSAIADILEKAEADLTSQMRNLIEMLWGEWKMVEQQIFELTTQLEHISDADAGCTRIRQIPGIRPLVATAIVAAIGNGAAFRKGRDFAAWLGVSCHGSIPPVARRSCSASASGATFICARF